MKTHSLLTKTQTAQETKEAEVTETVNRVIGTIIMALSGFILYLDKVYVLYGFEVSDTHGWKNTETYIWALCQTISPILIILGMWLRPYFVSLAIPITCYALQFYLVLDSTMTVDRYQTWVYLAATTLLVMLLIYIVKNRLDKLDELRNARMKELEKKLEIRNFLKGE